MSEPIALTSYSKGSGCGCKIAPQYLQEILMQSGRSIPAENLLVGNNTNDDAAVYDMQNGQAWIATVDFFSPMVDDAFLFGKIAAANAVSDVYAMGGKPIMATAILGWPVDKLGADIAAKVIEGAREICTQYNFILAGGHSIDSPEPFFGLSVNGVVLVENIKKNSTANVGDVLYYTKPLGIGIMATAHKRKVITEAHYIDMVTQLCTVNSVGEQLGSLHYVTAMTDVTGFGFLGHAIEMATGANTTIQINYAALHTMPGITDYTSKMIVPDNLYRNWNAYKHQAYNVKGEAFFTLNDPQTTGGLLIAIDKNKKQDFELFLHENGLARYAQSIGEVQKRQDEYYVKLV
jgi:selenide,water dikinase